MASSPLLARSKQSIIESSVGAFVVMHFSTTVTTVGATGLGDPEQPQIAAISGSVSSTLHQFIREIIESLLCVFELSRGVGELLRDECVVGVEHVGAGFLFASATFGGERAKREDKHAPHGDGDAAEEGEGVH